MNRPIFIALLLLTLLAACRQDEANAGLFRTDAVKIEVTETGVYQVTPDMLAQAGVAASSLTVDSVSLQQGDTAVPFLIEKDALIFYGQAPDNRYTAVRTYFLEFGKAGLAMSQTAVSTDQATQLTQLPVTVRVAEDKLYEASALSALPADEDNSSLVDLWFWQTLDLRQKKLSIPLDLTAVDDGSAQLKVRLWGQSENPQVDNDHDINIVINDQSSGTVQWDGRRFYTAELALPVGALQNGQNSLVLDNEAPGASFLDIMLLDWVEVTYMAKPMAVADSLQFGGVAGQATIDGFSAQPLLLDISEPTDPHLLTGWTFDDGMVQVAVAEPMQVTAVAPPAYLEPNSILPVRASDWHNAEQQADLLIITTDELAPALTPLVEARQAQGLAVAVVPLAEIYDAFGQGQAEPATITAFVRYALENWQAPQPRYLLLVGEATSDYRNYLGEAPANIVPSPMVPVQFSGETVSDSRLADVDGDKRPDLAIGRWPASSVAQVAGLVERTLAYEAGTADKRALFATDASERQFAMIAQRLSDAAQLTSDILNGPQASEVAMEINQGAWLATYIGHGSMEQWGKDNVFTLAAVAELDNTTPPIVLQLTCLTGLFAHPQNSSLSEQMLWHEGGPVIIVAATSLTLSTHQESFAMSLLQNLQDPGMVRIGDAFQAAKLSLAIESNNGLREISDTFVLLGDPSAQIVRP